MKKKKLALIILAVIISTTFIACSPSAPSDETIIKDLKAREEIVGRSVSDIKIIGKSLEGNSADIQVRYALTGPGLGDAFKNSNVQMHYKKYDTGWRFEGF